MNDEIEIILSEVIDGMESNSTSISMVPCHNRFATTFLPDGMAWLGDGGCDCLTLTRHEEILPLQVIMNKSS